jgi:hypothetical protein
MKRKGLFAVLLIIIVSGFVIAYLSNRPSTETPSNKQKLAVVDYLHKHFTDNIGLIYESEDNGTDPNAPRFSQQKIYYIYSDNLLAEYALMPYEPQISQKINQTIQSYQLQPSNFFEVLFGKIIPVNLSLANTLPVDKISDSIVLAEFHNSSEPLLGTYANALIYQSLNCYLKGNLTEAKQYFNQAVSLWDGMGIYDDATRADQKYANYKLALVLYASKVLDVNIDNRIEQKLWSMQQSNGGITSLADLNGNPINTCNAETSATALLPYNAELISQMHALFGSY